MKKLICALCALCMSLPAMSSGRIQSPAEQKRIETILNEKYDKYIDHIYDASMKTGLGMSEIAAFLKIESTFNPNAYNSKFGAAGLFQHIPSTWKLHTRLYAKKMGISPNASVYDPKASIYVGAAALSAERIQLAKDIGRDPKSIQTGELYLTHIYGYAKAVKILTAPGNRSIKEYVMINPKCGLSFYKGKKLRTVNEFVEGVNEKLEREKLVFQRKTFAYKIDKILESIDGVKALMLVRNNA